MKNKIILIFLIFTITIFTLYTISNAGDDIESIISSMSGSNQSGGIDASNNKLVKGVNVIYTLIRAVGAGIALLMVIVLGIKYMMASVEEKAEIKKQAVPILVGSGFVFATSQLLSVVLKIVNE